MDIFEWAENMPNADYYDISTGYVYCIAEYTKQKEMGIDPKRIRIVDSMTSETIGFAEKLIGGNEDEEF